VNIPLRLHDHHPRTELLDSFVTRRRQYGIGSLIRTFNPQVVGSIPTGPTKLVFSLQVAGNSTVNEILKFDVDGHLATITLNRPEAMNAQNLPLVQAMSDAFKTV
jgi:hypothetical protein